MSFSHNIYRNWMFSKTILTYILYRSKCLGPHFHPRAEQALRLSFTLTMALFVYYHSSAVVKFRTFHTATHDSSVELAIAASPGLSCLVIQWPLAFTQVEVGYKLQYVLHMLNASDRNLCAKIVVRSTQIKYCKLNEGTLVLNGTVWED